LFFSFVKKPVKTLSKTRDDVSTVPAVWMSKTICCVTSETLLLRVGGDQMSENTAPKLLGTKVGNTVDDKKS